MLRSIGIRKNLNGQTPGVCLLVCVCVWRGWDAWGVANQTCMCAWLLCRCCRTFSCLQTGTRCTSTYSTTHKSCPQLHSAQHSTPLTAVATTAAVQQALATKLAATQSGGCPVYSLVLTDSLDAASNSSRCLTLWLCAVDSTVTPTCRRFLGQTAGPACRCTGA